MIFLSPTLLVLIAIQFDNSCIGPFIRFTATLVVSSRPCKRHATPRDRAFNSDHALRKPVFPSFRLQHPRWHRGRRCVLNPLMPCAWPCFFILLALLRPSWSARVERRKLGADLVFSYLHIGTGAVYSFDPVGSYEREACRAAGAAQSLVQPFLDNQVCIHLIAVEGGGGFWWLTFSASASCVS